MFRLAAVLVFLAPSAVSNTVLSHEATIDFAWDASIQPILQKRFPLASAEDMRKAHAYAYGGSIVQDLGYYPFGNHFFSNLTHYVRGGDFIENLLLEARDLNELAFAIGSIAHYAGDHAAHSIAVNRSVGLLYPKLRRKFGELVSYENSPSAHLKVEFGFDVVQVALGHYAPEAYHDFIGFQVAKPLLERAFRRTYGLELGDAFANVDLALGSFRFSVAQVVPEMTKAAWSARKTEIAKAFPGASRKTFVYRQSRASYEKEWGNQHEQPGFFARAFGCIFRAIPRVGPFRAFAFDLPTPRTEALFVESFRQTQERYRGLLNTVRAGLSPQIPNENFDTGKPLHWGDYGLADAAYAKLLHRLAGKTFHDVDPPLRSALLEFSARSRALPEALAADLAHLKAWAPTP